MSDSSTSPTPEGNTKKGLSPLAWVGIGCGGVAALGLIVIVAGGIFVGNKVKKGIAEAGDNPERFAAEMIVKVNPDMEMVEANDEEGKMTIRMKKTGEELTFSYADIKEGKFSVKTSNGETIKVEGNGNKIVKTDADGKKTVMKNDGKTMKIEGPDGKTITTTVGKAGTYWDNLPAKMKDLAYPKISEAATALTTSEDDKSIKASFAFTTTDAETAVLKFYQEKLKAAGYAVKEESSIIGVALQGNKEKDVVKVNTIKQGDGKTMVMFFSELGK